MKLCSHLLPRVWRTLLRLRVELNQLVGEQIPWLRRDDGSMQRHAGTMVDFFTSILVLQKHVTARDADVALDLLRYNFPDVEHRWLAKRFERSMAAAYDLEDTLALAAAGKSEPERFAMALEILALLRNAGDALAEAKLFERVTYGLLLPGSAASIRDLFDGVETGQAVEPAVSVCFSSYGETAEVQLTGLDKGISFRAIRCAHLLLIINDGGESFVVRGRKLLSGGIMPLTVGQIIVLPSGPMSYEEIGFFLNAKFSGFRVVYYLHLEQGSLQVSRTRVRASDIRLVLGLYCELEVLRHGVDCRVNDVIIPQGRKVMLAYCDAFSVNGEGPFMLADVRASADDKGRSFLLDPGTRKIRVTNVPHLAQHGDLVLTPGLAPDVLFEVRFSRNTNAGVLTILEETIPLLVNQTPVKGVVDLQEGDLIRLGRMQSLRCRFSAGILDEEYNAVRSLSVEGVTKDFPRSGRVVDNIDFSIKRGEMTCIVGPSGSGKSTLLAMIAGHMQPSRGRILFNQELLYDNPEKLRRYVAYIPREDILDEAMTVSEHIMQAAMVRRPRLGRRERARRVHAILNYIGLTHLAQRRVGTADERMISDGERTRLNLGLDLAGAADIFLLDEPISGLSSSDAERVIDTLENITRDKIVLATLHRPNPSLLHRFQKILVLDHGGQMAYWGTPDGMMQYFRKAAMDLGIQVSADAQHSGGADYVFEILEAPLKWHDRRRRQHPRLWQERFEGRMYRDSLGMAPPLSTASKHEVLPEIPEVPKRKGYELWRLFRIWCVRTFLGRMRSRMGLYTMLLEGPMLALLIALTMRASSTPLYTFKTALHIPPYLFLSTVVAMFFGLTASASEVLKDHALLRRESNYSPFVTGYIGAKALILSGICALQCALYLVAGNWVLEIHEMFWSYWWIMSLTSFVGVAMSLMVSAYAKTERAALNIVPLMLVPQILMAGAMIPFEEMNQFLPWSADRADEHGRLKPGRVPLVADLCPLRYSYEMMVVDQANYNPWEQERRNIHTRVEKLKKMPRELTASEDKELRVLLRGLTALSSLEATDAEQARRYLRHVTGVSLDADSKAFDAKMKEIEALPGKKIPMTDFFVNDRILGISEFAEAQRQSRETQDRPSIFLAERQPIAFLGDGLDPDNPAYSADHGSIGTLWRDGFYLFIMGLVPLLFSYFRVKRQLKP